MATQAQGLFTRGAQRFGASHPHDDGLDAPGRPDSRGSGQNMEIHDVGAREDGFDAGEFQAASMEAEPTPEDVGVAKKATLPAAPTSWTKFRKGVRSIWAGKLPEDADKETIVKRTLRELVVYVAFVGIFSVVVFGMTTPNKFYLTNFLQGLFLDTVFNDTRSSFREGATIADFWRYAGPDPNFGIIASQLYGTWETFYSGAPNPDENYVLFENKLLGVARFRQLRVRNDSCTVHPDFADEIKQCYAAYSPLAEDNSTFGPGVGSMWQYQSEKQLNGRSYVGKVAEYGGGGYVMYLDKNTSAYTTQAKYLMDNLWIDRATRVVFLDFTLYNANVNLFSIVKLVTEFPPTGGMITSSVFFTTKLYKYNSTADYVVLVCEIIFILFTLYYIVEEALELKNAGLKKHFKDVWNWLDAIIILMSVLAVAFNLYSYMEVSNTLESLLQNPNKYPNFEFMRWSQDTYETAIAALVFFVWMKIFKYISFNKTMKQLSTTMSRCKNDLLGFGVMFCIIFLAFTQLAYLLFGTQIEDFKNFPYAMLALFRILLGDFDFGQLEAAQRVLGPIFFIAYMFFVFFVLLNMFLAIIGDTYSEVKAETANEKSALEMSEFFKKKYVDMLSKMRTKRDKLAAIETALGKTGTFSMGQFKMHLMEQGYTDAEVDAVVAKYDVNGDKELCEEEIQKMKDDLEGQRANLAREYDDIEERVASANSRARSSNREQEESSSDDEDDEDDGSGRRVRRTKSGRPIAGLTQEEFGGLTRRVDRMEHSIGSIVSKIDGVLIKLEAMEKAKLKRKETMGKLLDSINEADDTTDEMKRDQMERLVREELERWDSEGLPDQPSRVSLGSLGSLKAGGGVQSSAARLPTSKNK